MTNHVGHKNGQIVFATTTPYWHDFIAPPDMETIVVDDAVYASVMSSLGRMKFRVSGTDVIPIPDSPGEFYEWDWSTLGWALPPGALDSAKSKQSAVLNAACRAAIFAGFESSALGSPHHYPAKITDQNNLVASVTASLYAGLSQDWATPFWCESGGVWAYAMHTAAQIQQAGADGKAAILAALTRNEGRQQQVQTAISIEQVQAVVW